MNEITKTEETYKNNYLEKFEHIFDELAYITNSKDRLLILHYLLNNKNGSFSEIHKKLKLTYPTISNNVNSLQDRGFIIRKQSKFYLTNSGKIKSHLILDFNNSIKIIDSYKLLWSDHLIDDVPLELFLNINQLENSEILTVSRNNVYGLDDIIIENMKKSRYLYLIISEVNFKYSKIISEILSQNIPVFLIISQDIYKNFMALFDENTLKNAFYNKNLHILATNDFLKFNLFLNDFVFGINLFYNNGLIDKNKLLISYDKVIKVG